MHLASKDSARTLDKQSAERSALDLRVHPIYEYIEQSSPGYADQTVDRLTRRTEQIEVVPESGRAVPEYERDDIRELIEHSLTASSTRSERSRSMCCRSCTAAGSCRRFQNCKRRMRHDPALLRPPSRDRFPPAPAASADAKSNYRAGEVQATRPLSAIAFRPFPRAGRGQPAKRAPGRAHEEDATPAASNAASTSACASSFSASTCSSPLKLSA